MMTRFVALGSTLHNINNRRQLTSSAAKGSKVHIWETQPKLQILKKNGWLKNYKS